MSDRPFISVVMPVYNVEKHLKKAVESVLNQKFQDFEIILVDDCSPDTCPRLCDELAEKEERITVIHHAQNQGLSMSRNTGMSHASGKYIWFMDSDDYVDPGLFTAVKDAIQKNPAEITVFGLTEDYYDVRGNLNHSKVIQTEQKYYTDRIALRKYVIELEKKTLYGYAWNKVYDLDYLRKIELQFERITLIEDILFNVKFCMDIGRMNVLSFYGYHYNKRMDNSLTSKFVPEYYKLHKMRIDLLFKQYQYWNMCNDEVKGILGALYVRYIFSAVQRNCDKRSGMSYLTRRTWVVRLMQDPLVGELLPYAKSEGKLLTILIVMLQKKKITWILLIGRVIYICKSRLPMLFSVLKQKR